MRFMLGKLLIPLLLLALVLGAAAARADSVAPSSPSYALEEEIELEGERYDELEAEGGEGEAGDAEEASPEEECEEATEEFEEGEISREELEEACERQRKGKRSQPGPGGVLPEVCIVRNFNASAVANPDKGTVDLTVHYTTFEPTSGTISLGPNIDTIRRHLGARGTVRLHEHVANGPMKKLAATHKLEVQIDIPSTPSSCQRYYSDSAKLQLR